MSKKLLLLLSLGGCMVGEDLPPGSTLEAPSQLTVRAAAGDAHLTWKDNSADEAHFMVMRMEMTEHGASEHEHDTDHELSAVATLDAGATDYHDTQLVAGHEYMFAVSAMNAAGTEAESNEVTFTAP